MKLDEVHIKNLIKNYRISSSDEVVYQFQECTYHYVKNWLKIRYRCNEDICQDFVLYILEYTGQILQSFPLDSEVKFSTWFSATLYNKFCDFTKSGEVYVETIDFETADVVEEVKLIKDDIIDELSTIDKCLWLFYLSPQALDSDMLLVLMEYTEKPLQDIFLLYQESLKMQYGNYQLKETYNQKIKQIDHKLSHYHNILKKGFPDDVLSQKILRLENRRYKYIRTLKMIDKKSFKVFVKLFRDYNHAYNVFNSIKLKLRRISS